MKQKTYNEELDAVEGEEASGDEEEPPVGVLADDLEKEVDEPEDPHPAEDDGGAKDGVRVGTDVHRLGLHRELRAHNLSLRWLNSEWQQNKPVIKLTISTVFLTDLLQYFFGAWILFVTDLQPDFL